MVLSKRKFGSNQILKRMLILTLCEPKSRLTLAIFMVLYGQNAKSDPQSAQVL